MTGEQIPLRERAMHMPQSSVGPTTRDLTPSTPLSLKTS